MCGVVGIAGAQEDQSLTDMTIDDWFQHIRVFRSLVPALIPCWNYTGRMPLTPDQIEQWAHLDTFDALSAWYDKPATPEDVQAWVEEAGLRDI